MTYTSRMDTVEKTTSYFCACGQALDVQEVFLPCVACGGSERTRHIHVVDTAALRVEDAVHVHGRSAEKYTGSSGTRRRVREQYIAIGPSADGRRRRAHRIFDRLADRYLEVVTDDVTGELHYLLCEPVSCHRGRGSAKRMTFRDAVSWALSTMALEERPAARS